MVNQELGGNKLQELVLDGLKIYEGKAFLESYGIFMGKTQLLEFGLKKILTSLPGVVIGKDELERNSLGQTRVALEGYGLRSDYNALLKKFVKQRNKMAHEFLANYALTQHLTSGIGMMHSFQRDLSHVSYDLEMLIIVFDFINEGNNINAWLEPKIA